MKKYFFMFIVERKYLLSPFHYESVSFVAERDAVRGAKKQNLQRFSAKNALTVGDSSEGKRFHRSEMQTMVRSYRLFIAVAPPITPRRAVAMATTTFKMVFHAFFFISQSSVMFCE